MGKTFGDPSNYYSTKDQETASVTLHEEAVSLLKKYDPALKDKVERVCKRWNQILREHLRTETGLRFSFKENQRTIPVRVEDGFPLPFSKIFTDVDFAFWELLLNRETLLKTIKGLDVVGKKYDHISKVIQNPPATIEQIKHVGDMVRDINKKMDELKIVERIMEIKQDVLGAYFFKVPEIQIYWMVIGLLASMLNVSVEGLTVVVLTHELAHAYTHLGYDIDGKDWGTNNFAITDLDIVEGLAQHYTKNVCESKLSDKFPQASEAYQALLEKQTGPYRIHEKWTDDESKDRGGEIIRFTMINARLKNIRNIKAFENERETVKKMTAV